MANRNVRQDPKLNERIAAIRENNARLESRHKEIELDKKRAVETGSSILPSQIRVTISRQDTQSNRNGAYDSRASTRILLITPNHNSSITVQKAVEDTQEVAGATTRNTFVMSKLTALEEEGNLKSTISTKVVGITMSPRAIITRTMGTIIRNPASTSPDFSPSNDLF
ncbi:hypothetical protein TSMEX_008745 [Taenia solium]|eukprot:TsM_000713400 transcript=TsM_000713400 gene=TsM_000713400